jgi:hypothetical protein
MWPGKGVRHLIIGRLIHFKFNLISKNKIWLRREPSPLLNLFDLSTLLAPDSQQPVVRCLRRGRVLPQVLVCVPILIVKMSARLCSTAN